MNSVYIGVFKLKWAVAVENDGEQLPKMVPLPCQNHFK